MDNMFKEQIAVNSHEAKAQRLWQETLDNKFVQKLRESGLAEAVKLLPGFKESFNEFLDTVDCSDGRVLSGRKFGLAGSGILLDNEDWTKFVEANRNKIKLMTSHDDCGAAKVLFAKMAADGQEMPEDVTTADQLGKYRIARLAKELGAEYRHLSMDEMAVDNHNEVAVVIDGTGRFDSTNLEGFPPHFVCSAAGSGLSGKYVQDEVEILSGIAFGGHGFGQKLTVETPFHLIVVAKDGKQKEYLEQIVQAAVAKYGDRVRVDTITVEL